MELTEDRSGSKSSGSVILQMKFCILSKSDRSGFSKHISFSIGNATGFFLLVVKNIYEVPNPWIMPIISSSIAIWIRM
jgi:hypothetical protein